MNFDKNDRNRIISALEGDSPQDQEISKMIALEVRKLTMRAKLAADYNEPLEIPIPKNFFDETVIIMLTAILDELDNAPEVHLVED